MMPTALIWCALAASVRYDVPADALLSVYSVERGGSDTWSNDANAEALSKSGPALLARSSPP